MKRADNIRIARYVLARYAVFIRRVPEKIPCVCVGCLNVLGVVQKADCSPHISDSVIHPAVFFEKLADIGGDIFFVIFHFGNIVLFNGYGGVASAFRCINHFLNDIIGRANKVICRFPRFKRVNHGFVCFECVVLNAHFSAGALLVILFPHFHNGFADCGAVVILTLIDIILPVVNAQHFGFFFSAAGKRGADDKRA